MRCLDCETIDTHFFDPTVFWLHLPTTEGFAKLAAWCEASPYDSEKFAPKGLRVTVQTPELKAFIAALCDQINGSELVNTKILTTDGKSPSAADISRVMPASIFINLYQARWIIGSLEAKLYDSHFQPIVSGDGPRAGRVYGYEALFRMRDAQGNTIPPGLVFQLAGQSNLLFNLDLAARRSAVEQASRAKLPGKLFVNFNPSSIYDPSTCLKTTAAAIEALDLTPSDIVFELTETHQARDKAHLHAILAFYRNAGFNIALDDIGSGYSSLNMLHEMRPDYAKIDMNLVRDVDSDSYKQVIVTNLVRIAQKNGIIIVAEGIETEAEADFMRAAGADLLQGYFFGRPEPAASVATA